ncbi:MAG: flagellar hook-associated protein FlgK [Paracoccaceae bacterium]
MSINAALNSAASGLTAVSRATALVSNNIANAGTPGYARRTLALSSSAIAGVAVNGVVRHNDPVLTAQRRESDALVQQADIQLAFFTDLTRQIGTINDPLGLTARLADFESSLISAASRPDLTTRLDESTQKAADLAETLRATSADIQEQRTRSDKAIATMVNDLNTDLGRLHELNKRITSAEVNGLDPASLEDQRQIILDRVNAIVPVTVVPRPRGQIALYTDGGALLLNDTPAKIEFTQSSFIQPDMTITSGRLSGIKINGLDVRTGSSDGALRGGALGAHFALRDEWAVSAQADLDAVARDLIERFQSPAIDPTLGVGAAGLFTDRQAAFNPANEEGLSLRLELNDLVNPAEGGQSWRLRDGLGAVAQGDPGNSTLINSLRGALTNTRTPATGGFTTGTQSAASFVEALTSRFQSNLAKAQNDQSFSAATQAELSRSELALGVDSDAELQSLILLEQNFAANARVLETIDQMITELLRI